MNEIAGNKDRGGAYQEDDGIAASLKIILTTQTSRYLHISSWALMLLTIVDFKTVVIWYVLTMSAGLARSHIEKRMRDGQSQTADPNHRKYAFVAMGSCAFWAASPVIAVLSGHPFGLAAAMFLIVNGIMLAISQFRSTPTNALIVTAPYMVAYSICVAIFFGTAMFVPMLAAAPLLVASMYYVLMFGYMSQRQLNRADRERSALIEELESARVAAEKASEAKSMFLANMSHEIRTPMNGVLGMAELLAATKLDNRQQVFADTIHKSGAALLTIINDILDFSKIEAGKLEIETASFDLRASVEDVAALVATRAQEKQIELIVRCQPDLPVNLLGDGGRLRQVITNLVGNAVKFTEQGYVLINVSGDYTEEQASIRIEVTDTGIGIDAAVAGQIFNPFQQADSSTTRKFGGTGLGLSISKRLIEAMGGKIGVTSKIGEGSTFWVELTLPTRDDEEIVWQATFEPDSQRVLVVDDIDVNRQIVTEQLAAWGFSSDAASSGEEALIMMRTAAVKNEPYAIAILDFFMPEMDGEELVQRIKDDAAINNVALIVLTSVDHKGDARRFRELGVDGYLVKPARAAMIFETIAGILQTSDVEISFEEDDDDNSAEPGEANERANDADKINILLAEDNEVNQLVVKHMLDANLYDLVIADNGLEALRLYEADPSGFDLILMDVSMPEMDGHEATRAIRALENGAQRAPTPIVCLTAHVMAADVERSRDAGMDDYLSKPISKEKLDQVIERWTGKTKDVALQARG
ncbi:BarA sensory histidine kinase (= VarS = GacS) [hydrothermal vent metagenome]|uniref:histidine kinase n=1 Tax=hydrothermal vent metagenome TaxID=652676 RepID=A0A3B0RUD0_9ZZZZ